MGRFRGSAKALSIDIYERSDGRYHVVSGTGAFTNQTFAYLVVPQR
jgi:hypothetical protein